MRPLAILALATAASAYFVDIESRQTPNGTCAKSVHVIAIGGSNSNDPYSLGLLITLATNITAAIPDSDYVSLPYDKVQPSPQKLYPNAIPDAINLLGQYVSEYHSACPDSKIAIIAYSSGAVISSLALCTDFTVPQSLATNTIIANVEYGSQTRNPGQPYNLGTCVNGGGTDPLANPAGCGNYIGLTQSYCDVNDPQCCDGPPQDYQIHFVYPSEYDLEATQFVVDQYKKLGGGSKKLGGASSSTSSTSSTSKSSKSSKSSSPPASHSSTASSSAPVSKSAFSSTSTISKSSVAVVPTTTLSRTSSVTIVPPIIVSSTPVTKPSMTAPVNASVTTSTAPPTPPPISGAALFYPSATLLSTIFFGTLVLLGMAFI